MKNFEYYTDGAATMKKVDGEYIRVAGGWGYIKIVDGEQVESRNGGSPETTNNAMELYAIYAAIRNFIESTKTEDALCTIYTDSAYSMNIYTQWAANWEKNGWTRGKKHEKIENLDIIKETWNMLKNIKNSFSVLEFEKVKGHSGNKYNEMVDLLAVWGKECAAESGDVMLY